MHSCCQESLPYHIWELAEPFIVRAPLNTLRYQVEVTTFSYSILLCRFQSLLSLVTVLLRDHWISSPYISRFGLKFQFHLTKRKKNIYLLFALVATLQFVAAMLVTYTRLIQYPPPSICFLVTNCLL